MNIRPTRFLETGASEIIFEIDKKILKKLVIIKKIWIKLIFRRYISLDQGNLCKFKAIYTANDKNNMIKVEKKDLKAKAKQFINKKQQ